MASIPETCGKRYKGKDFAQCPVGGQRDTHQRKFCRNEG